MQSGKQYSSLQVLLQATTTTKGMCCSNIVPIEPEYVPGLFEEETMDFWDQNFYNERYITYGTKIQEADAIIAHKDQSEVFEMYSMLHLYEYVYKYNHRYFCSDCAHDLVVAELNGLDDLEVFKYHGTYMSPCELIDRMKIKPRQFFCYECHGFLYDITFYEYEGHFSCALCMDKTWDKITNTGMNYAEFDYVEYLVRSTVRRQLNFDE